MPALAALILIFALAPSGMAAPILFTGPLAFSGFQTNWVNVTHDGVNSGSVDVSAAPGSVTLNGPDTNGPFDPNAENNPAFTSTLLWSVPMLTAGTVTFHWSYTTTDTDPVFGAGPAGDPGGFFISNTGFDVTGLITLSLPDGALRNQNDGIFAVLSVGDAVTQSGNFSVSVAAGDQFGFFVNSIDNIGGAASLTISNADFTPAAPVGGAVPEPATALLLIPGLVVLAMRLRRRA